jgi:hypothetical protein
MNIYKRIKYFNIYRKTIDKHKDILFKDYNVKVDSIYRLYTVYNIDIDEYNAYGGKKPPFFEKKTNISEILNNETKTGTMISGEQFFEKKVNANLNKLDTFLVNIGLSELYGLTEKTKLDDYNVKVVVEYKYIKTRLWANLGIFFFTIIIMSFIIGGILAIFL